MHSAILKKNLKKVPPLHFDVTEDISWPDHPPACQGPLKSPDSPVTLPFLQSSQSADIRQSACQSWKEMEKIEKRQIPQLQGTFWS